MGITLHKGGPEAAANLSKDVDFGLLIMGDGLLPRSSSSYTWQVLAAPPRAASS